MSEVTVFVVDDDADVRDSVRALLESAGFTVADYESAKRFLSDYKVERGGCLVADIRMPDMDGLELQEELVRRRTGIPVIIVTGHGDVPLAVRAMKAGAVDFIEKPFDDERLLDGVRRALELADRTRDQGTAAAVAAERLALLTPREREVLDQLVAGGPNKVIGHKLGISPRTVEVHRGHLMEKLQARSLSELVRMALASGIRTNIEK